MSKVGVLTRVRHKSPLLHVGGEDAVSFLNGLVSIRMLPSSGKKNQHTITADESLSRAQEDRVDTSKGGLLHCDESIPWNSEESVYKLGVRRDGRYGTMMKSNGRVLSDFFVYPTPFAGSIGTEGFLVEFLAPGKLRQVLMMLKLHKLNAQVSFTQVECDVWTYEDTTQEKYDFLDHMLDTSLNNSISKSNKEALEGARELVEQVKPFYPNAEQDVLGFAIDERNAFQGYRVVTKADSEVPCFPNVAVGTPEEYRVKRLAAGIVEAGDLPPSKADTTLPFEMNVDWMCGINSDKGCYIGQELTLRTWTSNAIPKRILPLELEHELPEDDIEGWTVRGSETAPCSDTNNEPAAATSNSPFASTKAIKPRRDKSIVGELITASSRRALCSIRKEYFDYDYVMAGSVPEDINKPVWLHKGNSVIKATIRGDVWV